MSLDERLRTGLREWAGDIDESAGQSVPAVLERGRRKARAMTASTALAIVAIAAGGIGIVIEGFGRPTQTLHHGPFGVAAPVATKEPASQEIRRSYGVDVQWKITSGRTSGLDWTAYAILPDKDRPCLVAGLGGGSCFAGFQRGRAVHYSVGVSAPSNVPVTAVYGFTQPHVAWVRIIAAGREPVPVRTVGVAGWPVRLFATVIPSFFDDLKIADVAALDADGRITGPTPFPAAGTAAIDGTVVDSDTSDPVREVTVVIEEMNLTATASADGTFTFDRLALSSGCAIVTVRIEAPGYKMWRSANVVLRDGVRIGLDARLSTVTATLAGESSAIPGGEGCVRLPRRADP